VSRSYPLIILFSLACSRPAILPQDPATLFDQAKQALDSGNYDGAAQGFQRLIFNFPGSQYTAEAQFYLAESYLLKKDYQQALLEYDFFCNNFPASHHYPEAYYKLGLCHLRSAPPYYKDQAQTHKARELLKDFLIRFPESHLASAVRDALKAAEDRLARKEYEAARLYLRYGELKSALKYLEYLNFEFPDSRWTWELKFLIAEDYRRAGDAKKAQSFYEKIAPASSAPAELKRQAQIRLNSLNDR
jgi:outer membrane protein assembly factor BamD